MSVRPLVAALLDKLPLTLDTVIREYIAGVEMRVSHLAGVPASPLQFDPHTGAQFSTIYIGFRAMDIGASPTSMPFALDPPPLLLSGRGMS